MSAHPRLSRRVFPVFYSLSTVPAMNTDVALFWLKESLQTGFVVVGPLLGAALAIGIVVSLFQAVTSMQEMTLSFIPKLLVMALVFFLMLPWMLEMLVDFTVQVFSALPSVSQ